MVDKPTSPRPSLSGTGTLKWCASSACSCTSHAIVLSPAKLLYGNSNVTGHSQLSPGLSVKFGAVATIDQPSGAMSLILPEIGMEYGFVNFSRRRCGLKLDSSSGLSS